MSAEQLRAGAELRQMTGRLIRQFPRPLARALHAQQRHEGRLAGGLIPADRLAGDVLAALDVQQVVGDLERQAQIPRIVPQRPVRVRRRLAEDRSGDAGEFDDGAGLQRLQPGDRRQIELGVLRLQVDHLAAHHAGRAAGLRQRQRQFRPHQRIGMGGRIGQHLECHRQQSVAGQDRGRLVELPVHRRPAAAQIGIVHRRQIVMGQAVAVQHLDRRRHAQRACIGDVEQPALWRTRNGRMRLPPPITA